jgi:hypothetical protein
MKTSNIHFFKLGQLVSIVTRLWARPNVLIPGRGKGFFPPKYPDQLWGPAKLIFNGYQVFFPGSKVARA